MVGRVKPEVLTWLQRPDTGYKPEKLLAALHKCLGVANDSQLAACLDICHSNISLIRSKHCALPAGFMIAVLDALPDLTLAELRAISGYPKDIAWGVR